MANKASKRKTQWKGVWDYKLNKYVGTGQYKGRDKPEDHSPAWWKKDGAINSDRYLIAYTKSNCYQDLQKEFWFATVAQIQEGHETTLQWCDDNGYERIRKLRTRKPRVKQTTIDGAVASGKLKKKATT